MAISALGYDRAAGREDLLSEPLRDAMLRVSHVSKRFGGTLALDDVSLILDEGEVLALLGHNGSGKSTLIKILAGVYRPDGPAQASIGGVPFELGSAGSAWDAGLRFVHQDLGLVSELDAIDNVALVTGYVRSRLGRIDRKAMVRHTEELLRRFGIDLDVAAPIAEASAVQRSGVAIARALWDWDTSARRILILDEPTAALPSVEVDHLFDLVTGVRAAGHRVIYVTHRMDEVFRVADRVAVLRSGRVIEVREISEFTPAELAEVIAGGPRSDTPRPREADPPVERSRSRQGCALRVSGLSGHQLRGVDLEARYGEIVGIAGLHGSGRDELPYLLAGAQQSAGARWELDGRDSAAPTTATAVAMGIAFVPPERAKEGLIAGFTVGENLTLANLARVRRGLRVSGGRERQFAAGWLRQMGVPEHVVDHPIGTLSGGNQQRVLLAKWFCTDPTLLVVSEPTAGVDVAARRAIYDLMRERVANGMALVMASSDIEDLIELSDRVVVLRNGEVVCELEGDAIQRREILTLMERVVSEGGE
jgi:ribose transport system ATP-binding protein